MAKRACSLSLSVSVWDRLDAQAALLRRSRSAMAEEILDLALARFEGGEPASVSEPVPVGPLRVLPCRHLLPPTAFCWECDRVKEA